MAESINIEVLENQATSVIGDWTPDAALPWTLKATNQLCHNPDDITLPGPEWTWADNWKVIMNPGECDQHGWEYASYATKFDTPGRAPKSHHVWTDRARRRLWSRTMRREGQKKTADIDKALPKIQEGLNSIHAARLRIEEIMRKAPESSDSDQMKSLVKSVRRNIGEIQTALNKAEKISGVKNSHTYMAKIKKLRNETSKEEVAIERALIPDIPKPSQATSSTAPAVQRNANDSRPKSTRGAGRVGSARMGAVTGGNAKAFNPSLLTAGPVDPDAAGQDGVFLDRLTHEQMIAKKFVAVDQATVMQEIIEERSEEISKVKQGLLEVNEMFEDLARIVKNQEVEIDAIYDQAESSHAHTAEAFKHIVSANRLQNEQNCIIS
jgi:hypothetical protein